MTAAETAKLVAMILANWPAHAARLAEAQVDAMIDTYHSALVDLPSTTATAAFRRLQATSKFIPSPAEILEAAYAVTNGAPRAPGVAWKDVRGAIGRYGKNRTPGVDFAFEDPLVARAVAALGWVELCESENPVADRARFFEIYGDLRDAERVEAVTRLVPGAAAPPRIGGTKSVAELASAAAKKLLESGKKGDDDEG